MCDGTEDRKGDLFQSRRALFSFPIIVSIVVEFVDLKCITLFNVEVNFATNGALQEF